MLPTIVTLQPSRSQLVDSPVFRKSFPSFLKPLEVRGKKPCGNRLICQEDPLRSTTGFAVWTQSSFRDAAETRAAPGQRARGVAHRIRPTHPSARLPHPTNVSRPTPTAEPSYEGNEIPLGHSAAPPGGSLHHLPACAELLKPQAIGTTANVETINKLREEYIAALNAASAASVMSFWADDTVAKPPNELAGTHSGSGIRRTSTSLRPSSLPPPMRSRQVATGPSTAVCTRLR